MKEYEDFKKLVATVQNKINASKSIGRLTSFDKYCTESIHAIQATSQMRLLLQKISKLDLIVNGEVFSIASSIPSQLQQLLNEEAVFLKNKRDETTNLKIQSANEMQQYAVTRLQAIPEPRFKTKSEIENETKIGAFGKLIQFINPFSKKNKKVA